MRSGISWIPRDRLRLRPNPLTCCKGGIAFRELGGVETWSLQTVRVAGDEGFNRSAYLAKELVAVERLRERSDWVEESGLRCYLPSGSACGSRSKELGATTPASRGMSHHLQRVTCAHA